VNRDGCAHCLQGGRTTTTDEGRHTTRTLTNSSADAIPWSTNTANAATKWVSVVSSWPYCYCLIQYCCNSYRLIHVNAVVGIELT